jgi:iron complex outermembrane receptor protein
MWKGWARQRVWAAASRAVRTPSLQELGIGVDYPPVPTASGLPLVITLRGNPAAKTEPVVDAEVGYRIEIGTTASIDATAYAGRYSNLVTTEVSDPVVQFAPSPHLLVATQFADLLDETTRGFEVAGHWTPSPGWRLDGSYTAFHITPHLAATSRDPNAASDDGGAPSGQWQLRAGYSPGRRTTLNVAIFHAGPLEQHHVDPYTRADVTAEWRVSGHLSVMAIGQNLFDVAHAEFTSDTTLLMATQVPRSVGLRLRWTSR